MPVIESYITHIRIIEDAGYPTSPPPPSSAPENKKSRVIVVAVRKSGRLRLHKARENANGTFSIGKTWLLEDLTAIQTYGSVTPSNELEQQHMEWAGNEGFLVTIGKPYYWQAITAKEKDFFIQSLTRIYKKYTGGKIPELIGFDEGERQTLIGSSLPLTQPRGLPSRQERQEKPDDSVPPRPGSNPGKPPPSRNRPPSRERSREQGPPYQNRAPSREGNRENGGPQARTYNGPPSRDGYLDQRQQQQIPPYERAPSRNGSREPLRRPSEEAFLRKQASREQMQRAPGPFIPPRTRQDLTPQSSHSQLSREQTSSPVNTRNVPNGFSQTPPPPSRSDASSARFGAAPSTESLDTPISDSLPKVTAIEPNRLPTNKAIDSVAKDGPAPQRPGSPLVDENRRVMKPESASASDTKQDSLPDRRRPPFQGPAVSFGQRSTHSDTNDNFSTPLTTPSTRDGDGRAPSRSSDRPNPSAVQTKPAEYFPPPQTEDARSTDLTSGTTAVKHEDISQKTGPSDSLASVHDALSAPTPFPDTSTPPTESKQEESFRPGLGPMMKKKSTKDIAKTLRMAATAYNAFKPRAGGAAERFFAEKEKLTGEPDGITGVVPAPIQRGISNETSRSATPDSASNRPLSATGKERPFSPLGVSFKQEPPKVQITRTATDNGQSLTELPQTQSESPGKSRSKSPGGAQSDRRRKRKSESSTKYLTALGLDPAILEGHSTEFDGVLTELAWNGRLPDEKSIDELEVDVRREIGRVQAGSWLGHMEQQEGKIEQLSRMFDRCMEECEELDGLLTLYAHELNVSCRTPSVSQNVR